MNYRELQLRQLIKNNYVPKTLYQQETAELKEARAQDLIDQLQRDLGINFLLDYGEIIKELKGRTVRDILEEEKQLGEKNKDWEERFSELEELNNQQAQENKGEIKKLKDYNQAYLKKIGDLEKQLFSLAKEKIKGKKEAEGLVKQLEDNWKEDKEQQAQTINNLQDELTTERKRTGSLREDLASSQAKIKELTQTIQGWQEKLTKKQQEFNERLRKINLLFDDKAGSYETIDFTGLYQLLVQQQQNQDWVIEDLNLTKQQLTQSQNQQEELTKQLANTTLNLNQTQQNLASSQQTIEEQNGTLTNLQENRLKLQERLINQEQSNNQLTIIINQHLETINYQQQAYANLQRDNQKLTQQLTISQGQVQNLTTEQTQLYQELQSKRNWGEGKIPQLKQELFVRFQATLTELQEAINKAWITRNKEVIKSKLEELNNLVSVNNSE